MRLAASAQRRRPRSLDDALLPLVNIVFLLMIFFLFVGRLGGVTPDKPAPGSRADIHATPAAPRVLELRADGRLRVDGREIAEADLAAQALAWRGQAIDVQAPADAAADRVLRLLSVLRQSGVGEVRLLTVRARSR